MTQDTDTGPIWLDESAMRAFRAYKEKIEEDVKAEQKPAAVVESACNTALEVAE